MTRTRRLKITFAYGNPKGHPPNDRSGDVADRFFCFACGRDHRAGSDIARDHKRYSIEGGHESGGIFSDLWEFYLQTKGSRRRFAFSASRTSRSIRPASVAVGPRRRRLKRHTASRRSSTIPTQVAI